LGASEDLDKALKSAKGIEDALKETDDKTVTRKMRFETNPNDIGNAVKPDLWIKRNVKPELTAEELTLARMVLQARDDELPDEYESRWQNLADKVRRYTMTSGGTGTGAELTDTVLWSQLLQDVIGSTEVANLFSPFIDMSTGKMELSELGDAIFYKPAGEGQAVTATDLTTAKRSFNAYVLKAQVDASDELDEDAIIAMIPSLRLKLIQNAKEVIDEAIVNADASTGKTNINYYKADGEDIPTTSRFLIGFDGLIHYCLNEMTSYCVKDFNGAPTVALLNTMLSMMGKYGIKPEQVAFISDMYVWGVLRGLGDFLTVDKAGAKATLQTGQFPTPFGCPLIVSPQIAKSAAGGYVSQTSDDNTKGRILAVNRAIWRVGFKRNVRIATQRDEAKGLTSIVASFRMALQCLGDRTSSQYTHTMLGYNATV
jgi:hypothetical protein